MSEGSKKTIWKTPGKERRGFSLAEVAAMYGTSRGFIRAEVRRGRLGASKLGRRVIVPLEALVEWMEAGITRKDGAI